jgi:mannose-6-phosphate isomerase-like protein (cupin superfamily)
MSQNQQSVFAFAQLESRRNEQGEHYLQFLDVDSLHCGIYSLAAGATDPQQPHSQDEIYFVQSGVAKIDIEAAVYDVGPGSIVFVPARARHRFHSIKEDLKTLVIFSKFEPPLDNK